MALYLVDGHALAYRSYYAFARRPLVNSKGEETSAVYGFTNTMFSLFDKFDGGREIRGQDKTTAILSTELGDDP